MNILQVGLPKSGNFWLYTLIKHILEAANLEAQAFIQKQPIYELAKTWDMSVRNQINIDFLDITHNGLFYRIGNIFRYPVDDIDDYLNNSTLVWTHSQFNPKVLEVLPKFDKVIYIVRDPRDVAISWANFVFTDYMRRYYPFLTATESEPKTYLSYHLKTIISDWINHISGYLKHQKQLDIHFVAYERLLNCFDREFANLLAYLDIELDQNAKTYIKDRVDFSSMKTDNPNHLRKGCSGQWGDILSDGEKKMVLDEAASLLKLLNYPFNERENKLPEIPANLDETCLDDSGKVVLLIPAPH